MSVELNPSELGFQSRRLPPIYGIPDLGADFSVLGPFTHEVQQMLRLRNPTTDPVAFKVRLRSTSYDNP